MSATITIHVHGDGTCHVMDAGPRDGSAGFASYESLVVALVRVSPYPQRLALVQEAILVARRVGSTADEISGAVAEALKSADEEEARWSDEEEEGE